MAIILAINTVIPFEWTHPYCNDQSDGPAWAAFGFPLPYREFSGASSLANDLMPHVLLLNTVLLAALASPLMAWTVKRLSEMGMLVGVLTAVPGALLLFLGTMILWFELQSGFVVRSIAIPGHDNYSAYRPIGITFGHQDCTPSEFWFGPIKQPHLRRR